jgi:two-component sensor histidine kinase
MQPDFPGRTDSGAHRAQIEASRRAIEESRRLMRRLPEPVGVLSSRWAAKTRAQLPADTLQALLEILPFPASIATGRDCREIRSNAAATALYKVGRLDNLSQSAAEAGEGVLIPHYSDGRRLQPDELPMQRAAATGIVQRDVILDFVLPDGDRRTISAMAAPLRADTGEVVGAVAAFADITPFRIAQQAHELLARELQHRNNNLLAVVQAIAHQSFARGEPLKQGFAKFDRRLDALRRANDILLGSESGRVSIAQIVRTALEPFAAQVQASGEDLLLAARQVQSLTMAIYELTTNAIKYGALRHDDGVVNIHWEAAQADRQGADVLFAWREAGGPPVVTPTRGGLGTRLLSSLYRDVRLDFAPGGLSCEIILPI